MEQCGQWLVRIHSDLDSEGFPYGYSCTMYKFHIVQICTRIPDSDPNPKWLFLGWISVPGVGVRVRVCEHKTVLNLQGDSLRSRQLLHQSGTASAIHTQLRGGSRISCKVTKRLEHLFWN